MPNVNVRNGRKSLALCASALICALTISPVPAASNKAVDALKLTQTHNYWGRNETTISAQGIRIDNLDRMHFSLVARSPDWTVTVFRDDDKKYIKRTFAQFIAGGLVSQFMFKNENRKFGQPGLFKDKKIDAVTVKEFKTNKFDCQYIPLGKMNTPQLEEILFAFYRSPTNGGIPVAYSKTREGRDWMTGLDRTGDKKMILSTSNAEQTKVAPSIFDPPKNYKLATAMQDVLMSKENRAASDDADQIIDSGR